MADYVETIKGRVNLETGQQINNKGEVIDGWDDEALEENLKGFGPKHPTLVGNIADLQRLGADAAAGKTDGVTLPPSPTGTLVKTDAQLEPTNKPEVIEPDKREDTVDGGPSTSDKK